MGLIKAFSGALSGTFADQWKDFIKPMDGAPATAGIIPGQMQGRNARRGSNTKGSENIITDGSRIVVPDGYAMVTVMDGGISAISTEPGGYTFSSDDSASQSVFSGGGVSAVVAETWNRFKFGGRPGGEQLVFYVNLKEIPNNRFGTQSEIFWDDAYLGAQAGAMTRGSYTLQITDPMLFLTRFVPASYLRPGAEPFDFADMDNDAGEQLFNEVVSSLAGAFSIYTNDPSKGNRITKIQGDQVGFAKSLSQAVEEGYAWQADRGLTIVKVAIAAIEYDENTKKILEQVKEADAMSSGRRANVFSQMAAAKGIQAAGENGGGAGLAFMGMGMNAAGGMVNGMYQQPDQQQAGVGAGALFGGGMPAQQQAAPQQAAPQQAAPAGGGFCPNCGGQLMPGAKFCGNCGSPVQQSNNCPNCGAEIVPGAKFCGNCGSKLG